MIIHATEAELEKIHHERFHHPDPAVRLKLEVIYLKLMGYSHQEIGRLCRITQPIVRTYLTAYKDGGLAKLTENNHYKPQSKLEDFLDIITADFEKTPPANLNEASARIEGLTGIKRSPEQVRVFLRKHGFKRLKVGYVPGKAATPEKIEEQEVFKVEQLEPRLEEAKAGKRKVIFLDAAHLIHAAFLGVVWCLTRIFIPSPTGRQRFNILGALDAVTKELTVITNETTINAETVCQMLLMLSQKYVGIPITIVLDNARYQHCDLVVNYAKQLGIELLFLPSYSPNLNLIERYWKFLKKEVLYSKYYPNFQLFKEAIQTCIAESNTKHQDKLNTLLTLKFQSFKKVKLHGCYIK